MFVGHYGPAAAAAGPEIKLWHGFVAVQFLDVLWAPFVLTGVEHVRITENFTASNHFDLYHMPYTHSLLMAVVWSVVAGFAYGAVCRRAGRAAAIMIAALVFSHWLLDLITHKPDLALAPGFLLGDDSVRLGFGLWDNRPVAFGLELALFLSGMAYYWSRSHARGWLGRLSPALLIAAGVAAQYYGNWGPPPPSPDAAAVSAIAAYAIFAALAAFVDATRSFGARKI